MRLLQVENYQLKTFFEPEVPPYAILSHVWEEEEVLFDDIQREGEHASRLQGFSKLQGACDRAKADGFQYIWIDTCCIDKSSSTELSEAINSMFKWYQHSAICYAFLSDVNRSSPLGGRGREDATNMIPIEFPHRKVYGRFQFVNEDETKFKELIRSRWFTRGWTLQELIAPSKVVFYDCQWKSLGDRHSLAEPISKITRIELAVLTRNHPRNDHEPDITKSLEALKGRCLACGARTTIDSILKTCSVASRMSWASQRETTRKEDEAYCLLGLFDVNMPLLYGEGQKAFERLQKEIIASSNDQSILVHTGSALLYDFPEVKPKDFIAPKPTYFCRKALQGEMSSMMAFDGKALVIDLLLCPCSLKTRYDYSPAEVTIGILDCHPARNDVARLAIFLRKVDHETATYQRYTNLLMELEPGTKSPLGCGYPKIGHPFPDTHYSVDYIWAGPQDLEELCSIEFDNAMARVWFDITEFEKKRIRLSTQLNSSNLQQIQLCNIRTIIQSDAEDWQIVYSFPPHENSFQDGVTRYFTQFWAIDSGCGLGSELDGLGAFALLILSKPRSTRNSLAFIVLGCASIANIPDKQLPWCKISGFTHPEQFAGLPDYPTRLRSAFTSTSMQSELLELQLRLLFSEFKEHDSPSLRRSVCHTHGSVLEVSIELHSFLDQRKLEVSINIQTDPEVEKLEGAMDMSK